MFSGSNHQGYPHEDDAACGPDFNGMGGNRLFCRYTPAGKNDRDQPRLPEFVGETRRRFRRIRQRRLAKIRRDPRRPRQHRRGLRSFRARGKTQRRSGPRSRCGQSVAGYPAGNDRRVLRRLHGHGQHREARARSAERKAARNRCDKNENGPGSSTRRTPTRRC